ncbi:MAG: hypothetical protein KDB22_28480 [Planctomycetales bacterium]|nr:hypothetical protein [Planctomycetales bacterium]
MRIGDRLLSAEGTIVRVRRLSNLVTEYETVHNLTVHQLQTYFVLAGQVTALVHNCDVSSSVPTNLGPFGSKAPKQIAPGTRFFE